MVEEYRNEIDRISKISKILVSEFWIDTILYEFDFGTKDTAKKIFARVLATILPNIWPNQNLNIEIPHFPALPTVYQNYLEIISKSDASKNFKLKLSDPLKAPKKLPISCYFPKTKIPILKKTQNFSIPRNLIFYITQNSKCNHQMLKKFYNCCKYFFAIQSTPLCYRLVLGWKEASKYIDESLFLNDKDLDFIGLDNLYITSSLDVITSKSKTLSNTIPKLYKCEAKYGRIDNQEININELEYLYYSLFPNGHINAICSFIVHDNVKETYYINALKILFPNK
uniref:Uncharacterized protein n=1 Tax=Panagrolaimus davidi TaxID=227884 RepID=A0A914Q4U7_9BILA